MQKEGKRVVQGKISMFSFLAALIVVIAKFMLEHADKDGNIYIKTPKQYFEEAKSGFLKFKAYLEDKHI